MQDWWNSLDLIQKILYCVAVPSLIVLVVQTMRMLFGVESQSNIKEPKNKGIEICDMRNFIGEIAEVTLTIPELLKGQGKIKISYKGNIKKCSAVTEEPEQILTGETVRVVDVKGDVFVVERE